MSCNTINTVMMSFKKTVHIKFSDMHENGCRHAHAYIHKHTCIHTYTYRKGEGTREKGTKEGVRRNIRRCIRKKRRWRERETKKERSSE